VSKLYRPLNSTERRYLCSFIRALVPVARDAVHPMSELARKEIALTMWRWTADAVHVPSGIVKPDKFKYNIEVHAATKSARSVASKGPRGLRHEHAVPRMELAKQIIDNNLDEVAIYTLLDRLCIPVIVTEAEDLRLFPKNTMPAGWDWIRGDPYARYAGSGLKQDLVLPPPWDGSPLL
jgi:hypothetical protein